MQILIQGLDYTAALDTVHPLTIRRTLNEPSVCELWLTLPPNFTLPAPTRNQTITISGDDNRIYFTGHLAATPMPQYAGLATEGPQYRLALRALSNDNLHDHFTLPSTQSLNSAQIPAAIHPLSEADGTLTFSNLSLASGTSRALANDITVLGQTEPQAYATEYFLGDGSTSTFYLSQPPYVPSETTLLRDLFNEPQIDTARWSIGSAIAYFKLGSGGLTFMGGNGIDGQSQITWTTPIEMGGTLLLEADSLQLASASTGILAGFFSSLPSTAGCIAGFRATATPGTGAVTLQPLVQGQPTGTAYDLNPGYQYTLRLRIHHAEHHRLGASYRAFGDSGPITAGGTGRLSPARLLFEIVEIVNGVAAMPVVLFDGSLINTPATCTLAAASSINLHGSLRAIRLTQLGSGWVVSTPAGSAPYTRRIGSLAQGSECHVDSSGSVTFNTGFTPAANEQIAVTYRTRGRATGRAINTTSQQSLQSAGLPPISAWIGTVTTPPARSSMDCRAAASALVQAANSASALWSGQYQGTQYHFASDINPGDALHLTATSTNLDAQVIVRSVTLAYTASTPDLVQYEVSFSNNWATSLSIQTSDTIPADAWLPTPVAPTYIANLNKLTVTEITSTTVTISTGTAPPTDGGFEVRRRDNAFAPGSDTDLVLRSTQQNLTFPRFAATDRYYIRMYDGQSQPNYSEYSVALFLNLPLSS